MKRAHHKFEAVSPFTVMSLFARAVNICLNEKGTQRVMGMKVSQSPSFPIKRQSHKVSRVRPSKQKRLIKKKKTKKKNVKLFQRRSFNLIYFKN